MEPGVGETQCMNYPAYNNINNTAKHIGPRVYKNTVLGNVPYVDCKPSANKAHRVCTSQGRPYPEPYHIQTSSHNTVNSGW